MIKITQRTTEYSQRTTEEYRLISCISLCFLLYFPVKQLLFLEVKLNYSVICDTSAS